ncbi:MAG: MGMT family protein [Planctomycetota bacterium]
MPSPFDAAVYAIVRRIPRGRVTTYGDIAKALGRRGHTARAVGSALRRNPDPDSPKTRRRGGPSAVTPCHRVVRANGAIGGYGGGFEGGIARKIALLAREDIRVRADRVERFKSVRWQPAHPSTRRQREDSL